MVTIKHTRESIAELEQEREQFKKQRDQYKSERDELSDKLDKECNGNYKLEGQLHDMAKERDSLLKENKALRLQADEYFELWQEAIKK